jgi:hypothetical protein
MPYWNYFSSFHVNSYIGQLELQTTTSDAIMETLMDTAVPDAPIEYSDPSLDTPPVHETPLLENQWAILPQATPK